MQIIDQRGVFPKGQTPLRSKQPLFIVIHYSQTSSPASTVKVLNNKGLSTHYEVDQQGLVHQYVEPLQRFTLHGKKWNSRSIGIDVTSKGTFSPAQVQATRELVTQLRNRFSIPGVVAPDHKIYSSLAQIQADGAGVLRHRNLRPTACPGTFPMDELVRPAESKLWLLVVAGVLAGVLVARLRRRRS